MCVLGGYERGATLVWFEPRAGVFRTDKYVRITTSKMLFPNAGKLGAEILEETDIFLSALFAVPSQSGRKHVLYSLYTGWDDMPTSAKYVRWSSKLYQTCPLIGAEQYHH